MWLYGLASALLQSLLNRECIWEQREQGKVSGHMPAPHYRLGRQTTLTEALSWAVLEDPGQSLGS